MNGLLGSGQRKGVKGVMQGSMSTTEERDIDTQ